MSDIPEDVIESARVLNMQLHGATKLGQKTQWIAEAFMAERERHQWQPIKDAPRDGMTVDLWNSTTEERRADARFINGKWRVWGQDGFENMGWVAAEHQDGFTHFMHIPVAPHSSGVTP